MGVFETIFRRPRNNLVPTGYFKMLNGYTPVFTNAPESVYEMEITRAAIHSFATFCSKLKPEITGSAKKHLERTLQFRPNPFQDTTKFLYRLATILAVNNTAFIVPLEDKFGGIAGYYPLLPQNCEVLEVGGAPFLRYTFSNGQRAAIEFDRVGILTQFQYSDDFFGEDNRALRPTMQLIHANNQGIINGVKNSASIRFLARIANMLSPEDIKKERERFTEDNLSADNQSGMIIYDQKFADVKQVDSKPFTVNAVQMGQINENVFNYFGTSAGIIQNKYTEDEWNAYYEGKIEPFALQLSLVMSNMTFTPREIAHGNAIVFTANRLQYASNQTKLNISTQLFDRGLLNRNGVMDIWNMAHVEGGEKYYIRKEYTEVSQLGKEANTNAGNEGSGISVDGASVDGGGEEGAAEDLGYNYDTTTKTYTVYNADGLMAWNEAAQKDQSINCTLSADINMAGKEWTPIGTDENNSYNGTFDGNGKTITGLTVNQSEKNYAGLFGCLGSDGKVQNLTLENVHISGVFYVGSVVGTNFGTVSGCTASGNITGTVSVVWWDRTKAP